MREVNKSNSMMNSDSTFAEGTFAVDDTIPIPNKRYFTIGEISNFCGLKQHVLRYWEQEFTQLKPKRRGNRRYYQRDDVILIREIKRLLYREGFTISGARAKLSAAVGKEKKPVNEQLITQIVNDLENVLAELTGEQ